MILTMTLAESRDTDDSVGGKLDLFSSQNLSRKGDCRTEAFTLTTSLAVLVESQTSLSKLRKGDCRAENTKKRGEGYAREKTGKRRKASSFLMNVITVGMKKIKGERGWLCERENGGKRRKHLHFL